jgi:tetratricopeptide (TPR) repeat protein
MRHSAAWRSLAVATALAVAIPAAHAQAPAKPRPAPAADAGASRAPEDKPLAAGRQKLDKGDAAGAIEEFSRIVRERLKFAAAYQFRGYAYLRLKQPDKALADFNAALSINPRLPGVLAARGKLRANDGDITGGLDDLGKAIAINPKFNRAILSRAYILRSGGDLEGAIKDFEAAHANDPDDAEASVELAQAYDFRGLYKRAVELLDDAAQRNPDDADILSTRCRANLDLNLLDAARADCDNAIALDPKLTRAYVNRAMLRARATDLAGAREDVAKALSLSPSYAGAFQARGEIDIREGNFEAAIADLGQAIKLAPTFPRAHGTLGFAYMQTGDKAGAVREYGIAARLQPVAPSPHANYARALVNIEDFDQALIETNEALRLNARYVPALIVRGRAYEGKKDYPKALEDFEAALKIAPENSLAQAGRDRIRIKMTANDSGPATGRVALVVGNSAYRQAGALANPKRDAAALADEFRKLGFTSVELVIDATRGALTESLKAFTAKAARAEWAVLYFAGHGMEADGVNYLVPVDAQLQAIEDTPNQTVALDQALNAVASAKKLRLIILDACRDNPFEDAFQSSRSGARGLARIEPETGTLVAFATKHGHVATDGDGANSPFATALVKRIDTPGLEINKLFRQVHDDVAAATQGRQEPFTYGQLPAEDYFFRAQ